MKPRGFVDIDGVIANWTKAMVLKNGLEYPKNSFLKPFGLADKIPRPLIDATMEVEEFWVNLEKFPWADDIVKLMDTHFDEWWFLTKACFSSASYSGKAKWIKMYYPQFAHKLIICYGLKHFACRDGDILIDDHPINLEPWNKKTNGKGFFWQEMTPDCHGADRQLQRLERFIIENTR